MKDALSPYFSHISDPRSMRNQHHPFLTIIGVSFLSVLSGIDSFSGMQLFAEAHLDELEKYFDFPSGAPSHDTFQRFWDSISPNEFLDAFTFFTQNIEKITSDVISIDGKTIRNSGKNKSLHIVSAWCRANQLVLGQEKSILKAMKSLLFHNFLNFWILRTE